MQENHNRNMIELKMHTIENGRIITPWKLEENSSLENDKMDTAHPGK